MISISIKCDRCGVSATEEFDNYDNAGGAIKYTHIENKQFSIMRNKMFCDKCLALYDQIKRENGKRIDDFFKHCSGNCKLEFSSHDIKPVVNKRDWFRPESYMVTSDPQNKERL